MKKFIMIASLLLSTNAFAAEDNFGLGIILGQPTGISANYKFSPNQSIDGTLAYKLSGNDEIYLHSTYLFRHPGTIFTERSASLGWYGGIGGRVKIEDRPGNDNDFRFGIRGAIGASLEFNKSPFEIFAELAPVLGLVTDTDLDINGGLGARYYF